MGVKKVEESFGFELDTTPIEPTFIPVSGTDVQRQSGGQKQSRSYNEEDLVSCLRNEKVTVKYIPKPNANITNQRHVLYGGLAEAAVIKFTVPRMRSGALVNVLTDSEKSFLENYMSLEHNAMSVYSKSNNYWTNNFVRLTKSETILDLSIPEDYIKYKILLANKDFICPSLKELEDRRKVTYQFVLINEGDESRKMSSEMSVSMEASIELGKIVENKAVVKYVTEVMSNRPISKKSTLDFIQPQAFKEMQRDPKLFLSIVKDPHLKTKVLIAECLEAGIVRKRGDLYYLSSNSEPLCELNGEATMTNASKYLDSPKHQEIKLTLEAKLKATKE